jgi:hypothetical protein
VRVADAAATIAAIHARGGRTTQRTHGADDAGGGSFGFPMADELANGHVSLPTHRITVADAERVAAAVAAARADGCAA